MSHPLSDLPNIAAGEFQVPTISDFKGVGESIVPA